MQTFLTEKRTKETILNKKRNLFGLGFTSLIAACGSAADSGKTDAEIGGIYNSDLTNVAPTATDGSTAQRNSATFEGQRAALDNADLTKLAPYTEGPTAERGPAIFENQKTESGDDIKVITFSLKVAFNGGEEKSIKLGAEPFNQLVYKDLTPDLANGDSTYDLVFGSNNNIFIYWDINERAEDDLKLTITGAGGNDQISNNNYFGSPVYYAPEFFNIDGGEKYDMVIGARNVVHTYGGAGAIYILWDIANYNKSTSQEITLGNSTTSVDALYGSLAIYDTSSTYFGAAIGEEGIAPYTFLNIGGDVNYDMVINSLSANDVREGAYYILWDVAKYAESTSRIDLGKLDINGATFGSLAIYGAQADHNLGSVSPNFLQIGGKDGDNKLDMIFGSAQADKNRFEDGANEGAVYVLWDVVDYYGTPENPNNISIDLGDIAETVGLLTIYGATVSSTLGNADSILYNTDRDGNKSLSDFNGDQINDIVVRDNKFIYIVFGDKVAEINDDGKVKSKVIDLGAIDIVEDGNNADGNFFNYRVGASTAGSEPTQIGGATAGYEPIQSGDYCFDASTAGAESAHSVDYCFDTTTEEPTQSVSYPFDGTTAGSEPTQTAGSEPIQNLGYRFADDDYETLAEVQTAYAAANPTELSNTDADLGVWDIA